MTDPYISEFTTARNGNRDFVEIRVEEGTDVSDLRILFYNNGGQNSKTRDLGDIENTENGGDIYVVSGSGIASSRAFALIDASTGDVIQFVSSGQTVTAKGGPAAGQTSRDVGTHSRSESMQSDDGGRTYYTQSSPNPGFAPAPVCYAPGTLILTDRGEVAVEDLEVGDRLVTADNGLRPIRWIGRTSHSWSPGPHKHKPIEIKAGALGPGVPRRTLIVSPQHSMLFAGPVVEELFGDREVLALARALVGLDGVRAMNGKRTVTYYSLLCDRHEIILAQGAWSETFHPGPTALRMIGAGMREEVAALFPARARDATNGYGPKVRRTLNRKETEALVETLRARGLSREDDITRRQNEAAFREWDEDLRQERMTATSDAPRLRLVE